LRTEVEDKEYKYNTLLREIEVKDMHIGQLETMLKRKDDELDNLRQTNSKILGGRTYSGGLSDNAFKTNNNYVDENRKFNSSDEFQKNEENENQLKRLMNNYNSERSETKQPGKIYSIRKK
jgi:hypothetical protein